LLIIVAVVPQGGPRAVACGAGRSGRPGAARVVAARLVTCGEKSCVGGLVRLVRGAYI